MKPDEVRRAAHSLNRITEVDYWSPTDPGAPIYMTLGNRSHDGPVRDLNMLSLRLTKEEVDEVLTALTRKHEETLTNLGVDWLND